MPDEIISSIAMEVLSAWFITKFNPISVAVYGNNMEGTPLYSQSPCP